MILNGLIRRTTKQLNNQLSLDYFMLDLLDELWCPISYSIKISDHDPFR